MKKSTIATALILSLSILGGCGNNKVQANTTTEAPSIVINNPANTLPTVASTAASTTQVATTALPAQTVTVAPTDTVIDLPNTSKGYSVQQINGITYVNGILIANKTYSLPASYNPGDLDESVKAAFSVMEKDATAQGLNLYISSGFRSYNRQNTIYNNYVKVSGKAEADRYSARAGYSEHQTGLAFDLNSIDDSFTASAEGQWVAKHAHKYGFIVRYPKEDEATTGYMYESWHLRYLGIETATAVYNSGMCLEEYLGITSAYSN